jgi:hypothetical protein
MKLGSPLLSSPPTLTPLPYSLSSSSSGSRVRVASVMFVITRVLSYSLRPFSYLPLPYSLSPSSSGSRVRVASFMFVITRVLSYSLHVFQVLQLADFPSIQILVNCIHDLEKESNYWLFGWTLENKVYVLVKTSTID